MEAEKKKSQLRDEMIKTLSSDKLKLQQEVTHLGDLLKQQAEREEKRAQEVKSQQIKTGKITLDLN